MWKWLPRNTGINLALYGDEVSTQKISAFNIRNVELTVTLVVQYKWSDLILIE